MRIIIDTNALVRFFTDDIPQKASRVEKLFKDEKDIFIPDVVFPEIEYILIHKYNFPREKLLNIYIFLSSRDNIHVTSEVKKAIEIFENSKLDMADCIVAAYSMKGSLASFDRGLLTLADINPFWK